MKRSPIIGYIVRSVSTALPVEFEPRDGLLYFGSTASVFPSRYDANKAIRRTREAHPDFEGGFGALQVTPLRAAIQKAVTA